MRGPLALPRLLAWCAGLAAFLAVCVALGVAFGAGGVASFSQLLGWGPPLGRVEAAILLRVRLPRVLLAALLGGSLSTAGAAFQALLRNPLADPYVLGVSGGASVGGVLALVLGLASVRTPVGQLGLPVFSFLGALAALLLIERIATLDGKLTVFTMLLTGAIFNAFSGAVIYFLQSIASLQELHAIVFYLMGSVPSYDLPTVGLVAATAILATLGLLSQARSYNVLSLGEESALQLGVEVDRVKRLTFALGALLTSLAVAAAGLIGFVGLIVPHLLRLLIGPDHRLLVPASFLGGAAFLVLADLLARVLVAPAELPVGVVTALAGGPFFLYLMRRRRGHHGAI
jgi:iron complex transport system permease protein